MFRRGFNVDYGRLKQKEYEVCIGQVRCGGGAVCSKSLVSKHCQQYPVAVFMLYVVALAATKTYLRHDMLRKALHRE